MSAALTTLGRGLVPQPPLYGRVTDENIPGGTSDVLWDNGHTETAVPNGSLQFLTDALAPTQNAYSNRVVRPLIAGNDVASAEYDSKVVTVTQMNVGFSVIERLILQTLSGGMWFDELPANVRVLNNR